jgi:hypothetical protein
VRYQALSALSEWRLFHFFGISNASFDQQSRRETHMTSQSRQPWASTRDGTGPNRTSIEQRTAAW